MVIGTRVVHWQVSRNANKDPKDQSYSFFTVLGFGLASTMVVTNHLYFSGASSDPSVGVFPEIVGSSLSGVSLPPPVSLFLEDVRERSLSYRLIFGSL